MHYEGDYRVESITQTREGQTFQAVQHVPNGLGKYRRIREITVPDNVDLSVGDVVRLRIENHSGKSGHGDGSWALDRFIGFPYEKERGWDYSNGL